MKPIIGITTLRSESEWNFTYVSITEAYISAISKAGGVPILVPLGLSEADLDHLSNVVDGLVLTGGGDIDPGRYGGNPHPSVQRVDSDRDRVEIHLARNVAERQKPFLGVCRGMQIINVAFGGSLYEDIASQHPNALKHDYFSKQGYPRNHAAHPVQIREDTLTSRILGQPILEVNSLHHQAVKTLAPDLEPTAFSPDGVLEGFEAPGHPFGIGVQWHPEWLTKQPAMESLFRSLVLAVANGRGGK